MLTSSKKIRGLCTNKKSRGRKFFEKGRGDVETGKITIKKSVTLG